MKRVLAYYLLVAYLLALLKPVLPVAQDALAHTFWRLEHIATVHHFSGENHVHNDIKKAGEDSNADEQTASKFGDPVSTHLLTRDVFEFSGPADSKPSGCFYQYKLTSIPPNITVPPPKHFFTSIA